MTQQPVEANVVLTADNSQYDSAMQQSAAGTDQFGTSVDSLGAKIDRLTKSAGKKLFGIAAVDLAGITAATVAYGHFEKQMTSLNAQAAILNKNMVDQRQTFNTYSNAVNKLRGDFGVSTSEAAGLVQQITRLQGSTANVDALSKSFAQLAAVTGEAPTQLASSILQFQKTMGGAVRDVPQLNNTLASLASSTNTTVSAIADFSQSIAPMGRMIGMTTNEVAGVSTAFIRAGQDGYTAANAFNKMVGDIAYSTQTGSPDLAKYANLIGVTVDQFSQMNKTQAVTRIFDELNRQGPAAITTLNRMGLDGMRTMRAITAMSQQTGGIGAAIAEANNTDPGALARGAEAVHDTLSERLARTRSELAMTGEAMGKNFEPPAKAFLSGIEAATKAIHELAASPLGRFVAIVMTAIAPVAALAGALLTLSKAALAFSALNVLFRNPLMTGLRAGRSGSLSPEYHQINNDGNFIQRGMMAGGARFGGLFGPRLDEEGNPVERGPGIFNRAAGRGFQGLGYAARFLGYQYNAGQWDPRGRPTWDARTGSYTPGAPMYDPTSRERMFQSRTLGEAWRNGGMSGMLSRWGQSYQQDPYGTPLSREYQKGGAPTGDDYRRVGFPPIARNVDEFGKAVNNATKETYTLRQGLRGFGQGMAGLTKSMGGAVLGMGATGLGAAGKLWGAMGGNPLMAGMIGYGLFQSMRDHSDPNQSQNYFSPINPYLQAGGAGGTAPFTSTTSSNRPSPMSVSQAQRVTSIDQFVATSPGRSMSQTALKGMTAEKALAFLGPQYSQMSKNPQAIDALKLDLISQFGPNQAQTMLSKLQSGSYGSSSTFMTSAFNQPRQNYSLMGINLGPLTNPSAAGIGNQMDLQLGINQTAVADVARKFGTSAGFAEQSKQDQGFIGSFSEAYRNRGLGQRALENFTIGGAFSPSRGLNGLTTPEEQFLKRIQSNQNGGLGLSTFGTADYKAIQGSLESAKNPQDAFKVMLGQVFRSDQKGPLGVSMRERQQLLGRYGLDPALATDSSAAIDAIIKAQKTQYTRQTIDSDPSSLGYRIAHVGGATTRGGTPLIELDRVQQAIKNPENMNKQVIAFQKMTESLEKAGKSAPEIQRIMGDIRAAAGDESDPMYRLASQAQELNYRKFGYSMDDMGAVQRFGMQTQMVSQMRQTAAGDPHQQEILQQADDLEHQNQQATKSYFLNLIYAQRNFDIQRRRSETDFGIQRDRMDLQYNLSRSRAQYDFNLQRQYEEQDFALQKSRAEFDFQLQQKRGTDDFYRSLNRSRFDFNLSRKRDEEDYQHQVVLMTKQAAIQMQDIYSRVQVQQTASSGFLLFNAQDQLKKMRGQSRDLRSLRRSGISDDVIQQFGLTDPKNAQQLARMVSDIAQNPKLVQQFNEAVSKRLKAARSLVTDQSSSDWQEFTRQHRIARNRAMADFQRSVTRSLEDFHLQMNRAEDDFRRSMNRSQDDFEKQMKRANKAFDLSMTRAAEDYAIATSQMEDDFAKSMRRAARDLNLMAQTIDGNLEHILEKWVDRLSGHAKKQAQAVLDEFTGMGKGTTSIASQIMENLSSIFGVHYNKPKIDFNPFFGTSGGNPNPGFGGRTMPGMAAGGVLPGYTPGRDVHHFYSPTGGNLSLSGGEAIMRPEWTRAVGGPSAVKQMNDSARQGFASGGVVNPDGRVYWDGEPISRITKAQLLLAEKFGKFGIGVMQGSWQPRTSYSGTSHMGPGVVDTSPATKDAQYWLRRVGFAAWGRNVPWGHSAGSGAHIHSVSRVDPGARNQAQLSSFARGEDGLGGLDYGPNPPVLPNLMSLLGQFTNLQLSMGSAGAVPAFSAFIKETYPQLERYISQMSSIRPLQPGQMSKIINANAKKAYQRMFAKYGMASSGTSLPGGIRHAPEDVSGNKEIVRDLAAARGWTGSEWDALYQLVMSESSFNNNAQNPGSTAYGLFQFLDSTWGNYDKIAKTSNPRLQTIAGLDYIKGRYGDPIKAWKYHMTHGSYGSGAIFNNGMRSINVGERGPEMVLPLNDRGADFIRNILERSSVGPESKSTITSHYGQPIAHNLYNNYKIDKSTNFTGPITLQAHDPNDFIAQLKARQRTKALTQPQLAGSN